MAMKFTAALLHTRAKVLREDKKTLLLGGDRQHLAPDGEDLPVCVHPVDKAEVEPL